MKKTWPVWTTRSALPTCTFMWTCGVRPWYQPGKMVRKLALPSGVGALVAAEVAGLRLRPGAAAGSAGAASDEPPSKPEYSPEASACQISTSAPLIGLHVLAFTIVNSSRSGSPGLPSRTSWRVSLLSIQYGPSVTSGVSTQVATFPSPAPNASSARAPKATEATPPPRTPISPRRLSVRSSVDMVPPSWSWSGMCTHGRAGT